MMSCTRMPWACWGLLTPCSIVVLDLSDHMQGASVTRRATISRKDTDDADHWGN